MPIEAWVALVVAAVLPSGGLFAVAWQAGRRDGQLVAILDELRRHDADHEARIRVIELGRPARR